MTLDPDLPFLSAGDLLNRASAIDLLYTKTKKTIARLDDDVSKQKTAVASRWRSSAIDNVDRRRFEAEEVRVACLTIRKNAQGELDGLLKEAGKLHAEVSGQRPFYVSPVMTLNRSTLGDPRRTEYLGQLQGAIKGELSHLGQFAVSTKNHALAAAIATRVESMPSANRPFSGPALADALRLDEHRKAVEAIKIVDARFQAIVLTIRTWNADKANPVRDLGLAFANRDLDPSILSELDGADGRA